MKIIKILLCFFIILSFAKSTDTLNPASPALMLVSIISNVISNAVVAPAEICVPFGDTVKFILLFVFVPSVVAI